MVNVQKKPGFEGRGVQTSLDPPESETYHGLKLRPLGTKVMVIHSLLFTSPTVLKIKVLNWHLWFHNETLTPMETFHSSKGSLL